MMPHRIDIQEPPIYEMGGSYFSMVCPARQIAGSGQAYKLRQEATGGFGIGVIGLIGCIHFWQMSS
jgi:hypothetical protein